MLAEVNKWKPRLFRQKVLHAAEWGQATVLKLAFSSKNAHLLSTAAFGKNSTVPLGYAALGEAARHNRYPVVKLLIEKGLDLNAAHVKGTESCLHCNDNTTTYVEQDLYTNPLHDSVAWGNFRIIRLLLENGANPNARTCGWGQHRIEPSFGPPRTGVNAPAIDVLDTVKRTTVARLLLEQT